MPFKSKAQAGLMFAAAQGKSDKVSPAVGQEFVNASKGTQVSKLPVKKKMKAKRKK